VVPVIHAVNAALHNFAAAAKLLRFLCHIVLRCNQTQFPLTSAHERDPIQPPDWMLQIDCDVVLTAGVFCGTKTTSTSLLVFTSCSRYNSSDLILHQKFRQLIA
jgi:hypothetical protein